MCLHPRLYPPDKRQLMSPTSVPVARVSDVNPPFIVCSDTVLDTDVRPFLQNKAATSIAVSPLFIGWCRTIPCGKGEIRLDHTGLIHEWLHDAQDNAGAGRHIIRFRNAALYRHYAGLLNRQSKTRPVSIAALPSIQGFCCPPPSKTLIGQWGAAVCIEEDQKLATVHALGTHTGLLSPEPLFQLDSQKIPWGVKQINAPSVWRRTTGTQVKIAIIDTGIDYAHPDLRENAYPGINLVHRHLPAFDDNGHGTHIAGTIAAASRRSGLVGVAPQAMIHPVKAFDRNGTAFVSDIIAGIEWCIQNRIRVINMSFGMKTYSKALADAVRSAYSSGSVIVASCGNEGKKGTIDYPARFPQTISVGATTKNKKIASFSNAGKRIDILAPGHNILSTWLDGKYHELSGTSMATSHISGVIALMLALRPRMSIKAIKETLKRNAAALPSSNSASPGEVNALKTVRAFRKSNRTTDGQIAAQAHKIRRNLPT
jgi:subtilisin